MSPRIPVGTKVIVSIGNRKGQVVGVREEIDGRLRYDVRVADANGMLERGWFYPGEIVVDEQAA